MNEAADDTPTTRRQSQRLMTTRKLIACEEVPFALRQMFHGAPPVTCGEEILWREFAARTVMDALGHTGITEKKKWLSHQKTIRAARLWLRADQDLGAQLFEFAGLDFYAIRMEVLRTAPVEKNADDPTDRRDSDDPAQHPGIP